MGRWAELRTAASVVQYFFRCRQGRRQLATAEGEQGSMALRREEGSAQELSAIRRRRNARLLIYV